MACIVIASGHPLTTNPRMLKEAWALGMAGHDVHVLSSLLDPAAGAWERALCAGAPWRWWPMVDLERGAWQDRVKWFWNRLRVRVAFWCHARFGWDVAHQLGHFIPEMERLACRLRPDLVIVHLEPGLELGYRLLRRGLRVAMDLEDWYSEDLLHSDRARRPLRRLRSHESYLMSQGAHVTTTSHALARELSRVYACPQPRVIPNVFPWADRETLDGRILDRQDLSVPSLTWFSQTIGPARGLEILAAALAQVTEPLEIHLRGTSRPGYIDAWLQQVPESWRHRIHVHSQVPQEELLSRLVEHDMGFAGEVSNCLNRELTISNKILEYLRAGLAVVASDTRGQQEVAERAPGAVALYAQTDPGDLARVLNGLLADPERRRASRAAALEAARTTYCWERVAPDLVDLVADTLDKEWPSKG
ncbi:MAG: glycosyltransferase [Magnetococcales bacterium]|nr:glycosyltransferase [Magnetococcales bacterium]